MTVESRQVWAPYSFLNPQDTYWGGPDLGAFTVVTVDGSQEFAEVPGRLGVTFRNVDTAGAPNVNALLQPRAIRLGQRWGVGVRVLTQIDNDFRGGGLILTDGVLAGSNAVTVVWYRNQAPAVPEAGWIVRASAGTINNLVTQWELATLALSPHAGAYLELEYVAVDTFQARVSGDGRLWTNFGQADIAKVMTPTHVGLCWTNWQGIGAGTDTLATFGPLALLAEVVAAPGGDRRRGMVYR